MLGKGCVGWGAMLAVGVEGFPWCRLLATSHRNCSSNLGSPSKRELFVQRPMCPGLLHVAFSQVGRLITIVSKVSCHSYSPPISRTS